MYLEYLNDSEEILIFLIFHVNMRNVIYFEVNDETRVDIKKFS